MKERCSQLSVDDRVKSILSTRLLGSECGSGPAHQFKEASQANQELEKQSDQYRVPYLLHAVRLPHVDSSLGYASPG